MNSPTQTLPDKETKPVEDSVPKINNELAVGADLEFQRRWWRWETRLWVLFAVLVVADLLGCFGRGPLAKAHGSTSDGTMDITYERIERYNTPSIFTIKFGPNASHDGKVQLWVAESLIKPLGNQRIIPQPLTSTLDGNGIVYTFPLMSNGSSVEFALEPSAPGIYPFAVRVPGAEQFNTKIYVVP